MPDANASGMEGLLEIRNVLQGDILQRRRFGYGVLFEKTVRLLNGTADMQLRVQLGGDFVHPEREGRIVREAFCKIVRLSNGNALLAARECVRMISCSA